VCVALDACQESAQPDIYTELLQQALEAACDEGQAAVARAVLARGADANGGCTGFGYLLEDVINKEALEVMQALLAAGAHVHDAGQGPSRTSALEHAARRGKYQACKLLLEHPCVSVSAKEVVAAVTSGELQVLQLLLSSETHMEQGAREQAACRAQCLGKALAMAVQRKDCEMVTALLAAPDHWGPLGAEVYEAGLSAALQQLGTRYPVSKQEEVARIVRLLVGCHAAVGGKPELVDALTSAAMMSKNEAVLSVLLSARNRCVRLGG
jgi:ankyrin repeat protein